EGQHVARLASELPGGPACQGEVPGPRGGEVVPRHAPADAAARPLNARAGEAEQVGVYERGEVHARDRSWQVPQVEAGVHLQQPQLAVRCPLEVELRDALQSQPLDAMAADLVDVALVARLERRRVAELPRPGPHLAAG